MNPRRREILKSYILEVLKEKSNITARQIYFLLYAKKFILLPNETFYVILQMIRELGREKRITVLVDSFRSSKDTSSHSRKNLYALVRE